MRTGVFARRVGQAADKPRRPTVLELHTWWPALALLSGPTLGCAKVGFVRASDLSGFCSGRVLITIQSREKQSDRRATCFRAKGTQCDSPGQRPGKMRIECSKPQRGEMTVPPITPFQGFNVRNFGFLGRCPRLSHFAALRQDPSETPSGVTEQKPDQQATPINATFAQPGAELGERYA